MGEFRILPRKELKIRKKMSPEELLLFDQFKTYVSRLDGDIAGIYDFSKQENREKCKTLLRKAAKALDLRIRIIEEENSLVFYRQAERGKRK